MIANTASDLEEHLKEIDKKLYFVFIVACKPFPLLLELQALFNCPIKDIVILNVIPKEDIPDDLA